MSEQRRYFNNKYPNFFEILHYFLEGGYLEENEDETIKRFCSFWDKKEIHAVVDEGKEILKLDPFPSDWITDTARMLLEQVKRTTDYYNFTEEELKDGEDIKGWTKWVVKALEKELEKK